MHMTTAMIMNELSTGMMAARMAVKMSRSDLIRPNSLTTRKARSNRRMLKGMLSGPRVSSERLTTIKSKMFQ